MLLTLMVHLLLHVTPKNNRTPLAASTRPRIMDKAPSPKSNRPERRDSSPSPTVRQAAILW